MSTIPIRRCLPRSGGMLGPLEFSACGVYALASAPERVWGIIEDIETRACGTVSNSASATDATHAPCFRQDRCMVCGISEQCEAYGARLVAVAANVQVCRSKAILRLSFPPISSSCSIKSRKVHQLLGA